MAKKPRYAVKERGRWYKPWFRNLNPVEARVLDFIESGPTASSVPGLHPAPVSIIRDMTGIDSESVDAAVAKLGVVCGLEYDPNAFLFWLPHRVEEETVNGKNTLTGFVNQLPSLPESPLVVKACRAILNKISDPEEAVFFRTMVHAHFPDQRFDREGGSKGVETQSEGTPNHSDLDSDSSSDVPSNEDDDEDSESEGSSSSVVCSLPFRDGLFEVTIEYVETLKKEHQGVDIEREAQAFAGYLAAVPSTELPEKKKARVAFRGWINKRVKDGDVARVRKAPKFSETPDWLKDEFKGVPCPPELRAKIHEIVGRRLPKGVAE